MSEYQVNYFSMGANCGRNDKADGRYSPQPHGPSFPSIDAHREYMSGYHSTNSRPAHLLDTLYIPT